MTNRCGGVRSCVCIIRFVWAARRDSCSCIFLHSAIKVVVRFVCRRQATQNSSRSYIYSHLLIIKIYTLMPGLDGEVVERADTVMEEVAQILSRRSLEERDGSSKETKLLTGTLRGERSTPGIIIHTSGIQANVYQCDEHSWARVYLKCHFYLEFAKKSVYRCVFLSPLK